MIELTTLLALLFPLLDGLLSCRLRGNGLLRALPCLLPLCSALLLLPLLGRQGEPLLWQIAFPLPELGLSLALRFERLGLLLALLASLIWAVVGIFAQLYLRKQSAETRRGFFFFFAATLSAFLALCFAANLFTLYLFFELAALLALPFISLAGGERSREAATYYLGYSVFGAALILLGMALLAPYGGMALFCEGGVLLSGTAKNWMLPYFLMTLGFGCKAGLLPLQAWLPIAHPVALTPGSALLSALITKSGVLGILRLSYFLLPVEVLRGSWVQTTLLSLATLTIFAGAMLAYREGAIKRCLAFSSVSQLSYVLLGIFLFSALGLQAALLQLLAHALGKSLLFLCAGVLLAKLGIERREHLADRGRRLPSVLLAFTVAALSMLGIPPFGGFWGKWILLQAVLSYGGVLAGFATGILLLASLLGAGYLLYPVLSGVFAKGEGERLPRLRLEWAYALPLGLLSALLLLPWLYPSGLLRVLECCLVFLR